MAKSLYRQSNIIELAGTLDFYNGKLCVLVEIGKDKCAYIDIEESLNEHAGEHITLKLTKELGAEYE